MSSTNRSRAKASSPRRFAVFALALAVSLGCCAPPSPGRAAGTVPDYWFAGTRLVFEHPQARPGGIAVASDDAGLTRLLAKVGATLSYQPGQRYAIVTTGDRRTITFAIGDASYDVAGLTQAAAFAPYAAGGAVYLPFTELARALDLSPVDDGGVTVLQPQIAGLDVRSGRATVVTLRGAAPLRFKRTSGDGGDHLTLVFAGIASTLEPSRRIAGPALSGITITVGGTARNPVTVVDFQCVPNAERALVPSDAPNALALAFAPPGALAGGIPIPLKGDATLATVPLGAAASALAPAPPAASAASAAAGGPVPPPPPAPGVAAAPETQATPTALGLAPATVGDVRVEPADEGLTVELGIAGNVTYEWHRLSDNRWYVDLKPATLAAAPQDEALQSDAATSLRVKGFVGPNDHLPTVRVALTLATPRIVDLAATGAGLAIVVNRLDDLAPQATGSGELAGGKLVASIVPLPPVAGPSDGGSGTEAPPGWKFGGGALAPGVNPRLIVLDPGHGGSDDGAMHNGLVEKELTLDISRRLRALLIARGWLVKMTRDSDVDVFAPNDSARDELQARCDVANAAGARLFVSVHINSFTSSDQSGTTTYYYKADSYGLADAIHARLAANLPTKDDGIRKENFYVIHHTNAPAVLVETAFISNPGDAQLLRSDAFLQKVASSIAAGVGDYAAPGKAPADDGADTDGS